MSSQQALISLSGIIRPMICKCRPDIKSVAWFDVTIYNCSVCYCFFNISIFSLGSMANRELFTCRNELGGEEVGDQRGNHKSCAEHIEHPTHKGKFPGSFRHIRSPFKNKNKINQSNNRHSES